MENLPSDIVEDILFRLPFQVMIEARRVCKTWKDVICNYYAFLRDHNFDKPGYLFALGKFGGDEHGQLFYGEPYDHAWKDYYYTRGTLARMKPHRFTMKNLDKGYLAGSCNGLVCLRKRNNKYCDLDSFEICNPLTGEYVLLPEFITYPHRNDCSTYDQVASGFGYCHSKKEYKVVTVYKHKWDANDAHVQVYTVGGKWKNIESINPIWRLRGSSGVYANGALHWLHLHINYSPLEILAFDLEDEEFRSIPFPFPIPIPILEDENRTINFKLLGERNTLYFVHKTDHSMDIWVYKRTNINTTASSDVERSNQNQNYADNNPWSWTKGFSINNYEPRNAMTFAISRNNEVLLKYKDQIFCYDPKPKTSPFNKFWVSPRMGCRYTEAIPHMLTVVSLRDLGETRVRNYKAETRPTIKKRKVKYGIENIFSLEKSARLRGAKSSKNC